MRILGISCHYHDAAAALVVDGEVVACASEERFSRKKHDSAFPRQAAFYCLDEARLLPSDLDLLVFYEKPWRHFERILLSNLVGWPGSWPQFKAATPTWLSRKLWVPFLVRSELGYSGEVVFTPHHLSHAASAFLPSPFDEAAILTLDGVGEYTSTSFGRGHGTTIEMDREIRFPHSLGLLYSAVTAHLGFEVNEGEGKVMGLASYGTPRFRAEFDRLLHLAEDGSFALDMTYFAFLRRLWMGSPRMAELLGPVREPGGELTEHHHDVAASLQATLEDAVLHVATAVQRETGQSKLCLAGGVALNCVANGRLLREGPFEEIFIQPASGDDGGALGAALFMAHCRKGAPRRAMTSAGLGPSFPAREVGLVCRNFGVPAQECTEADAIERAAELLAQDKIIGWFWGRMEVGPRALGNRSILASPRKAEMKDILNHRVKHREPFRPFAPAVPLERADEYFEVGGPSPWMLLAGDVRPEKRAEVPAITHVDGTARVQTVTREANGPYYDLIRRFGELTGTPVILNTSFNVKGEPLVCCPEDAIRCFLGTEMDALVIEGFVILKDDCGEAVQAVASMEALA